MSQNAYNIFQGKAFPGMKGDSRFDLVESAIAYNTINFGRGLTNYPGENDVEMGRRNVATITLSGDIVTSNTVSLTIQGTAVSVVFATSHANTVALLLAAIQAVPGVYAASADAAGHVFTVRTKGAAAVISGSIAGGATQATVTVESTNATLAAIKFAGISLHRNKETASYLADEMVDNSRQGEVWVETTVAVTKDQAAYVDLADGNGKFTNVSTGNLATGGVFKSTVSAAGIAPVEINLP